MPFYYPDQMLHGSPGNLFPWDIRFDPEDARFLSMGEDGSVRFRVLAEQGFERVDLVDGHGGARPLHRTALGPTSRISIWEAAVPASDLPRRYTFALLTADDRPVYRVPAGVSNAVERLDRWELDPDRIRRVTVPAWAKGAVIYQIFPDRFHRGDPASDRGGTVAWGSEPRWLDFQGGDLVGITAKVPYLADLGVDAVYVNPIFSSPSTHRYDAMDYYQVDPALGGNSGLTDLIEALHDRDMRLIVDASFNHCHPRFFAFADVVARGEESRYRDWFVIDHFPPRVVVRPRALAESGYRDPVEYLRYLRRFEAESGVAVVEDDGEGPPVEPSYEAWYGVPSLPRIDLSNPEARDYFLGVATHWVREYGIDGWRMDVARYVDFDFWPAFRSAVKEVDPEAYLIAEIMGDASRWLQGDTFDATMNYTFRQLCLDFFATATGDGHTLADGLTRMSAMYPPDVLAVCQNLLGSHDTPRFLHEAGEDMERLALATVFQLTVPGAPGLYYGDEVGMSGGEEPGSRGAFPWHDENLWDTAQLGLVRDLLGLRRRFPSLRHGDLSLVAVARESIAYLRTSPGQDSVLVVINRNDDAGIVSIDPELVPDGRPQLLWGDGVVGRDEGGRMVVSGVPEWGALVARFQGG